MKKMLILTMLLIVATTSFAQFKFSGTMRVRGNVNTVGKFAYPNYRFGDSYYFSSPIPSSNDPGFKKHYWSFDKDLNAHYFKFADADTLFDNSYQTDEVFIDARFRPTLEYKVNDNLNMVWTAEIGDITFGNNSPKGGAQGADGVNVETKNLFFDWQFFTGQKMRVGIQNYMDPMVMVVEDDFAGVTLESNWNFVNLPDFNTKIGWLKGANSNPFSVSDSYSTGSNNVNGNSFELGFSNYVLDASYNLDKNNQAGINILFQNRTVAVPTDEWFSKLLKTAKADINLNQKNLWLSPYYKGRPIYDLSVEAQLVINTRYSEYELLSGELKDTIKIGTRKHLFSMPKIADEFGLAFMSKINYKITSDLDVGFNFLYASGEALSAETDSAFFVGPKPDGYSASNEIYGKYLPLYKTPTNYYRGASYRNTSDRFNGTVQQIFSSQTNTGLEILGTGGVCDSRGISPTLFGDYFGTIMPILYTNYKLTKGFSMGLTGGVAMLPEEIFYLTVGADGQEKHDNKSRFIGSEVDVTANIIFDKLSIKPVAAFFFPSDLIQIAKPGTGLELNTIPESQRAPMIYEIGLKAEFRF